MKIYIIFVVITLCEISPIIYCFDKPTLKVEGSTTIHDDIQTRIIGGKPAKLKQIPYQVGLEIRDRPNDIGAIWCGGALISSEWIITAAHCIFSWSKGWSYAVNVTLGVVHNRYDEDRKFIYVHASNFRIRQDYETPYMRNDIALIKLPQPIEFNDYIQPVNLPRRSMTKQDLIGRRVTSSGWGVHDDGQKNDNLLRYTELKVISHEECNQKYGYIVDDVHVCINAPGRSACHGDSGGPNVITGNGTKTIIGVSSFVSPHGCKFGWPTVLTRVSHYLDWISEITSIPIRD